MSSEVTAVCEKCGASIRETTAFCTKCGARRTASTGTAGVGRFCTTCGPPLAAQTKFCTQCGALAAGTSEAATVTTYTEFRASKAEASGRSEEHTSELQ